MSGQAQQLAKVGKHRAQIFYDAATTAKAVHWSYVRGVSHRLDDELERGLPG